MKRSPLALLALAVALLLLSTFSIAKDFLLGLPIAIGVWVFLYLRNQPED